MRGILIGVWLLAGAARGAETPACDVYVSASSRDCSPASPGTGTLADPYVNLYDAITQRVTCGQTVCLQTGVYRLDRAQATGQDATGRFADDTAQNRRDNCDDDPRNDATTFDNTRALMPIFLNCTSGTKTTITNAPNAQVLLDGTDLSVNASNQWTQCESSSQCGTATGLSLDDHTKTFYSTSPNYNTTGAPDAQMWVDGATAGVQGKRLGWWANTAQLVLAVAASDRTGWDEADLGPGNDGAVNPIVGRFAAMFTPSATPTTTSWIARLRQSYVESTNGNYDPDSHEARLVTDGGWGTSAHHVVSIRGARHVTIEGNTAGGSFEIRHGFDCVFATDASSDITLRRLTIRECGGRGYGSAVRVYNASRVTTEDLVVAETMGQGISYYGGGPGPSSTGGTCGGNSCGIQLSGCYARRNDIRNTGVASRDGGMVNSNTGEGLVIKNCTDVEVLNNTLTHTTRRGIQITTSMDECCAEGFDTSTTNCVDASNPSTPCASENVVVDGNTIVDSGQIADTDGGITTYPRPLKYDHDGGGVHWAASTGTGRANTGRIVNNYVAGPNAVTSASGEWPGIKVQGTVAQSAIEISNNVVEKTPGLCLNLNEVNAGSTPFYNNIFTECAAQSSSSVAAIDATAVALASGHGNNAFDSATTYSLRGSGCASPCTCPATGSAATCWEASRLYVTPVFAAKGKPRILYGSPYIGAGVARPWTPARDIDGNPRGATWDVGAHQHGSYSQQAGATFPATYYEPIPVTRAPRPADFRRLEAELRQLQGLVCTTSPQLYGADVCGR